MRFRTLPFFLVCVGCLATAAAAVGQDRAAVLAPRDHPLPVATDLNLITAVDVSASITPQEEVLQYDGLARGVVDAQFLARIAEGAERRIGFAAFTWSSGGQVAVVVPWPVIATRADAERVAAPFNAAPRTEERRVGNEGVSTGSSRGAPVTKK